MLNGTFSTDGSNIKVHLLDRRWTKEAYKLSSRIKSLSDIPATPSAALARGIHWAVGIDLGIRNCVGLGAVDVGVLDEARPQTMRTLVVRAGAVTGVRRRFLSHANDNKPVDISKAEAKKGKASNLGDWKQQHQILDHYYASSNRTAHSDACAVAQRAKEDQVIDAVLRVFDLKVGQKVPPARRSQLA